MFNYIKLLTILILILNVSNGYALPSNIKVLSDISYGKDKDQTLDVYVPANVKNAPVIFMVHGGAWRNWGDKADKAEVENKISHWVTQGFVLISTNFRALPKVGPVIQAEDVGAALGFSQKKASEWGGSAEKFILMGHSSGAHSVSLVSSNFKRFTGSETKPVLGTVSMDSSAYNIVGRLTTPNLSEFYTQRFGTDPDYWQDASPFYVLTDKTPPFLAICSTLSKTACIEAKKYLKKTKSLGTYAELISINLSHGEINSELGKHACYTSNVDAFIKRLNPELASMYSNKDTRIQKECSDILVVKAY
ncbi:alpha/beta hydrolase [Pseudoalteromonas sp. C2R02]|uniref:alpha/beta hydrolase n=1 Tax=Pseudoalteromonas sp. C2R02 TaxID=2841565 RepID=UPI001C093ECC|nr:alpha/beta hydrolase [Pseudoalteromonas sp. C2R02]MBU2972135.1 alpha/beta hydrolase [Pseudoalteromonas sp. C2R02]